MGTVANISEVICSKYGNDCCGKNPHLRLLANASWNSLWFNFHVNQTLRYLIMAPSWTIANRMLLSVNYLEI